MENIRELRRPVLSQKYRRQDEALKQGVSWCKVGPEPMVINGGYLEEHPNRRLLGFWSVLRSLTFKVFQQEAHRSSQWWIFHPAILGGSSQLVNG